MAGNSTISITFKLTDDTNGMKTLTAGTADLKKVLSATVVEAEKLKKPFINFAALATGIDSVNNTISSLQQMISGLSDAYAAQIEVEKKLEVAMRNNLSASDAEIQSIKDLCAAQQQLGVIGDEVQLAGAQKLATFVSERQSLEQLIPAMNDVIAQQYGLNASQENAAQIASVLGKAITGQTSALKRYGFTLDESQEALIKNGTEQQRVAAIIDVITSKVGGMNAELAKTDAGKQKQLENTLGDIRETLGSVVQSFVPYITAIGQTTIALSGIIKLREGFLALRSIIDVSTASMKAFGKSAAAVAASGLAKAVGSAKVFISDFGVAVRSGAAGLKLFCAAWKTTLLTMGAVGVAIAAVSALICALSSDTDEATKSTNGLASAQERAAREAENLKQLQQQEETTLKNSRAALELNIARLKDFNGTKEQEQKIVAEMNNTYGETMGYFSSVADWYKALVGNSEAYCRQMIIEARTRMLANQIAEKQQAIHDLQYDENGNVRKYSNRAPVGVVGYESNPIFVPGTSNVHAVYGRTGKSDYEKYKDNVATLEGQITVLNNQMQDAVKEAAGIQFTVKGSPNPPSVTVPTVIPPRNTPKPNTPDSDQQPAPEMTEVNTAAATLREISENITFLNKQLQEATVNEAAAINKDIAKWEEKAKAIRQAGEEVKEIPEYKPAKVTDIKTIEEASRAVDYFTDKIRDAEPEQIESILRIRAAYEQLLATLNAPVEAYSLAESLQGVIDDINAATGQERTLKIQEIGVDGVADSVSQINEMLAGVELPDGIREWLEQLKGGFEDIGKDKSLKKLSDRAAAAYDSVGQLGSSFSALGQEIGAPVLDIAGTMMQSIANMVLAFSQAQKGAATMGPWAWIAFAATGLATLTSVVASVKKLPAFAEGGIISGPTVGLMGEYAGAANNPEVVAPLDRLRALIQPVGGMSGKVVFKMKGRTLYGVLENEYNLKSRS